MSEPRPQLLLVNPNTNAATTAAMLAIARAAAPGVVIDGLTAGFGVPLILDPVALATAATAVEALFFGVDGGPIEEVDGGPIDQVDGVIVAAFGDPGREGLAARLAVPVTGIAEAGMAEAAAGGRRFAIATTTAGLVASIAGLAGRYGHGDRFLGTVITRGDVAAVMGDAERLDAALFEACETAIRDLGAEAVVIGGGPLALAARRLAGRLAVPLIEPVPAAVRLALRRAGRG